MALLYTFRVRASTSARVTAVEVSSSATPPRYPSPRPLRRGVTVQLTETRRHRDCDHHARTAILLSTRSSHGALVPRRDAAVEAEALVERRSFETVCKSAILLCGKQGAIDLYCSVDAALSCAPNRAQSSSVLLLCCCCSSRGAPAARALGRFPTGYRPAFLLGSA